MLTDRMGMQCDLNSSVRARVSSSRTSFFTPLKLKSEMSTSKICVLTASVATTRCQHYWCTFQGKVYLLGGCSCKHILGVDTSDLKFGGAKKLVLDLETRAHTELFRIHGMQPILPVTMTVKNIYVTVTVMDSFRVNRSLLLRCTHT